MARSFEVHFCVESTTTECRVNYQMLAVAGNVSEVAQYGAPSWQLQTCSQPQPAAACRQWHQRHSEAVVPIDWPLAPYLLPLVPYRGAERAYHIHCGRNTSGKYVFLFLISILYIYIYIKVKKIT